MKIESRKLGENENWEKNKDLWNKRKIVFNWEIHEKMKIEMRTIRYMFRCIVSSMNWESKKKWKFPNKFRDISTHDMYIYFYECLMNWINIISYNTTINLSFSRCNITFIELEIAQLGYYFLGICLLNKSECFENLQFTILSKSTARTLISQYDRKQNKR